MNKSIILGVAILLTTIRLPAFAQAGAAKPTNVILPEAVNKAAHLGEESGPLKEHGEKAAAKVGKKDAKGKEMEFKPNQIGNFERIYVRQKETIPIEVVYPDGNADEPAIIESQDGGATRQPTVGQAAESRCRQEA